MFAAATAFRMAASMPAPGDIVASVSAAPPESEILAVGRDLAAALPGATRHPLKAIDDRAMDLASQDAELRAALFRFVDVVPACRDLDDLARHLTGFLDEVDERPPPLQVAMRMGASRAGRAALGAAAAAGVKHMAHRFIVGETPQDAREVLESLWREGVTDLVLELLSEDEFREGPSAGIVLQAYLRDSPELAERIIAWAQSCER